MSEHVSPLDATFLELEEADPAAHMHIGAVMVFEPGQHGAAPSLDALRADLVTRLSAMPRFRQRLSTPVTGGLAYPTWDDDPAFDVGAHVRRAALPSPGGEAELMDWVGDFWSHRLDRGRPLWEMVLLERLNGGRWALATKTHHAMVDGVGSIDVGHLLLDASPEPRPEAAAASRPAAEADGSGDGGPEGWSGALTALLGVPGAVVRTARAGVQAALDPASMGEAVRRSRALAELLARDELIASPATSLNRPIGKARRFAVVRTSLKDLKLIKRELGGTVNDVVLAIVTGGLRELLLSRGEAPPERGLRAMVPVNVRSAGERLALGNRITSLFVHLPVAEETPLTRYARTVEEAERLKRGDQALGGQTLLQLTAAAPPVVHATLARSLFASRLFNVTVTNVPGPQDTLYAFGAPMLEVFGLVPLAADHDVGIAILSYDGHVTFGVNADRDSAADLEVLVAGLEAAHDDLLRTARAARKAHAGAGR